MYHNCSVSVKCKIGTDKRLVNLLAAASKSQQFHTVERYLF